MDLEHPHLHHRDKPGEVLDVSVGSGAGSRALGDLHAAHDLRHRRGRMLLIEALFALPLGATHQAQWAICKMREGPVRDRFVILRQRQFCDALVGIKHAVRMSEPHPNKLDAAVARRHGARFAFGL